VPHLVSVRLHASQAAAESDEEFAGSPSCARLAEPEMERADGPQLILVSDVSQRINIKLQNLPSDPGHPCNTFQVGPSAHIVRISGCFTQAMQCDGLGELHCETRIVKLA